MIDTDKYEGHTSDWKWIDINEQDDFYLHSEHGDIINHDTPDGKLAQDAPLLLEEVKRLHEENKILAKYMEIVQKYDDALLADGDTDPRWSELYD
tara:strand:- start:1655 stop:1939 length:285 start_codon:yes stop_codon:yes gene_type:complete